MAGAVQPPVFDRGAAHSVLVEGLAVALSLRGFAFAGLDSFAAPARSAHLERGVDHRDAVADMHRAVGIAMEDDGRRHSAKGGRSAMRHRSRCAWQ